MINVKTYSYREMQKILKNNGWSLDHHSGSHAIFKKEGEAYPLVLGRNKSNKMIWQRLIKEHGLIL